MVLAVKGRRGARPCAPTRHHAFRSLRRIPARRQSRRPPMVRHPCRHSRESGNPHLALSICPDTPGFWIPAGAGMTVGAGMMVGLAVFLWRWRRRAFLPHPTLSRWERACAWRFDGWAVVIRRWLPYSVGAHGRAPLPGTTIPGHCGASRPFTANHAGRQWFAILFVIPAKAGIHTPVLSICPDTPGFWIPAGAGVTGWCSQSITDDGGWGYGVAAF